ncbi:uracil-DNA glycosylase family protein [Halobacterium zhouii]|uniref:uracil-DNA glycosylase family protein n=1 Tax=Halobacterium zhouii TaxID=2902624 RepID=UPI001E30424A|nr:uracil-DNA glycosylase family protein [Halobacterium zhouii]
MQNVTDRTSNPFDMRPPCETAVPGYGDANADFHVVGDHPGVHGGVESGVPFTGTEAATRLRRALADAGLLVEGEPSNAFFSYLHMCVPGDPSDDSKDVPSEPSEADYVELEPFFDAELRAITAHVLLPVGERATRHVLETYTAIDPDDVTLEDVHADELRGSGWLVVPALDPREWSEGDAEAYVDALRALRETDYRRESDLGRFLVGPEPYVVR